MFIMQPFIFVALALSMSLALALPAPQVNIKDPAIPATLTQRGSIPACDSATLSLASGIQANIDDQNDELSTAKKLSSLLSASSVDTSTFSYTQKTLLGFVNKGITIRKNNQKIAPSGNAAIAGLATVANAQSEELSLTNSLAWLKDDDSNISTAKTSVQTLITDFTGGIAQNKKNLKAATSACAITSSSSSSSSSSKDAGDDYDDDGEDEEAEEEKGDDDNNHKDSGDDGDENDNDGEDDDGDNDDEEGDDDY